MPISASLLRSRQIRFTERWITALNRTGRSGRLTAALRSVPGLPNLIIGYRRCFASLAEAQKGLGAHAGGGHNNAGNIAVHAEMSERPRESDYAAFYHLQSRAAAVHSVFDLGGSVGNLYYYYRRYLDWPGDLTWNVMDLPDVMEAGRKIAAERKADGLSFTADFGNASKCDLLIASGSLHYCEEPLWTMVGRLDSRPRYVLINRTPLTSGQAFATVQDAGAYRVACMIYNKTDLINGFAALGYRLVDEWEAAELSLVLPLFPERSPGPYTGLFLERH